MACCADLEASIAALSARNPDLGAKIAQALGVIERCLALYGVQHTCFSFNGGKDSTVLLHLLRVAVARHWAAAGGAGAGAAAAPDADAAFREMPIMFFQTDDEFPELLAFIEAVKAQLGLTYVLFDGVPYKEGLETMVRDGRLRAAVMGQRRGDPYTDDLDHFSPSTAGWPPFMRVSPVLLWGYADTWAFLRGCGLPYCALYERGYTSIGYVRNTVPNEALRISGGGGGGGGGGDGGDGGVAGTGAEEEEAAVAAAAPRYRPAYELEDERLERAGRGGGGGGGGAAATRRVVTFVTGNKKKLEEVVAILSAGAAELPCDVTNTKLDLPELQGEPAEVAAAKVRLAAEEIGGPAMTEDTSLCFNALGGLPGVYIKWFLEKLGHGGLNNMLAAYEDKSAYAQCIFAYCAAPGAEPVTFVGRTAGKIVGARGPLDFGWDPVFEPDEGGGKTFAEMAKPDKNAISHRGRALAKLKDYLMEHG